VELLIRHWPPYVIPSPPAGGRGISKILRFAQNDKLNLRLLRLRLAMTYKEIAIFFKSTIITYIPDNFYIVSREWKRPVLRVGNSLRNGDFRLL